METVNILYVDDNTDSHISEYLSEEYEYNDVQKNYEERPFTSEDSYETLLTDEKIRLADLIIIDSVLFENANFVNEKLAGEEFEIILKKIFPFKEMIVVTQNDVDDDLSILRKYDSSSKLDKKGFFENEWKPYLDDAIHRILLYRKVLKRIEEKKYVETYFLEEIQKSLAGEDSYEKLTVEDIDKLIESFEGLKREYE